MAQTTNARILSVLDELQEADFKRFKNCLSDGSVSPRIPCGKLENADRVDTAGLLIRHYTEEKALRVTRQVLENIDQRHLAQRIEGE
ncbi:hypothetical protein FKM82_030830, partial [Ascaphus truei]